jgi:hypothetical protein
MSRTFTAIAICLALTGAGCSQSGLAPPQEPEGTQAEATDPTKNEIPSAEKNGDRFQETSSPEHDGVRLTVRVPKDVTAGTPLTIDVKIANSGKSPVIIDWDTTEPMMVEVAVTTKDGKPVPFTQYGRKKIAPTELVDQLKKIKGSLREVKVVPGKKRRLSVANLALFYDLTLPGEYELTVSTTVHVGEKPIQDVALRVEKIPFTIARP